MKGLTPGGDLAQVWVQLVHDVLRDVRHVAYVLAGTPPRVVAQRGDIEGDVPLGEPVPAGGVAQRIRTPGAVHGQMAALGGVVVGLGLPPDRAGLLLDPALRASVTLYRLLWDRAHQTLLSRALAHEVRTPLSLISGYGELLAHRGEAAVGDIIVVEVERVVALLDEFMATGRPLERRLLDLAASAEEGLARYAVWADGQGVVVERRLEPTEVWADPQHVEFILGNLFRNAIESMPLGGTLSVRVRPAGRGGEAVVADTGPGVAPELRERLFQPYFTTKEGGHGLGLALAYDCALRHDGSLELMASRRGAVFRLWMPCRPGGPD
jgi:two-component system sensor histidine kinase HydH